jgi:hypothetical protein
MHMTLYIHVTNLINLEFLRMLEHAQCRRRHSELRMPDKAIVIA